MKEVILDSAVWPTKDHVCGAFFRAVGAPVLARAQSRCITRKHRGRLDHQVEVIFFTVEFSSAANSL